MTHPFERDTRGQYILPPPQLMPLYGLWDGSRWRVNAVGEIVADADARMIAALVVNWPKAGWEMQEIGPDGLPVEAEGAAA